MQVGKLQGRCRVSGKGRAPQNKSSQVPLRKSGLATFIRGSGGARAETAHHVTGGLRRAPAVQPQQAKHHQLLASQGALPSNQTSKSSRVHQSKICLLPQGVQQTRLWAHHLPYPFPKSLLLTQQGLESWQRQPTGQGCRASSLSQLSRMSRRDRNQGDLMTDASSGGSSSSSWQVRSRQKALIQAPLVMQPLQKAAGQGQRAINKGVAYQKLLEISSRQLALKLLYLLRAVLPVCQLTPLMVRKEEHLLGCLLLVSLPMARA